MDGNDAYIILVSRSKCILIYAFKSNKTLFRITENDCINIIRFSFDDYNIFLCSTNNAIKIYKISNSEYVVLNTIKLDKNADIQACYFIPKNNNKNSFFIIIYGTFIIWLKLMIWKCSDIYETIQNLKWKNWIKTRGVRIQQITI